jgi:hypothetical protein
MPLIDDHELEQQNHCVENVVEIVVAVSLHVEFRALQFRIPTKHLRLCNVLVSVILDHSLEDFHPNNRVHVIDNLQSNYYIGIETAWQWH